MPNLLNPFRFAGGGAWAPSDLGSALYQFYDPSDSGSLTLSGDEVTQMNDLSGNGFHLTPQTTGPDGNGNRSINSNNALNFESSELLRNTAVTDYGDIGNDWIFTGVYEIDSTNNNNDGLWGFNGTNDCEVDSANSTYFRGRLDFSGMATDSTASDVNRGATGVWSVIFDWAASTVTLRYNGVQIAQATDYNSGFDSGGTIAFNYFCNNSLNPPDGAAGPFIVASTADSTDLANIETWLADWAGVTLP